MADFRQQIHEYRERLHGMRAEMAAETVLLIANIELCVLDTKLRKCTKDELDNLQGQVKAWQTVQKYITQAPGVTKDT